MKPRRGTIHISNNGNGGKRDVKSFVAMMVVLAFVTVAYAIGNGGLEVKHISTPVLASKQSNKPKPEETEIVPTTIANNKKVVEGKTLENVDNTQDTKHVEIVVDDTTGVNYFYVYYTNSKNEISRESFVPRYNADGTLYITTSAAAGYITENK